MTYRDLTDAQRQAYDAARREALAAGHHPFMASLVAREALMGGPLVQHGGARGRIGKAEARKGGR